MLSRFQRRNLAATSPLTLFQHFNRQHHRGQLLSELTELQRLVAGRQLERGREAHDRDVHVRKDGTNNTATLEGPMQLMLCIVQQLAGEAPDRLMLRVQHLTQRRRCQRLHIRISSSRTTHPRTRIRTYIVGHVPKCRFHAHVTGRVPRDRLRTSSHHTFIAG